MFWEKMTSKEFAEACKASKGTCIIPFGVYEKHGTHLPLGTDVIVARKLAEEIARIEPVVIFPDYYFGQINEARHVPGTIAIEPKLMYDLLENICIEISRNGFKKIILLNSHGGNNHFVNYFMQNTLHKQKDYAVFGVSPSIAQEDREAINSMLGTDDYGDHAGNMETSLVMSICLDTVKMDCIEKEGLVNYHRLDNLKNVYTGIWWYAQHPTHFAGDPSAARPEVGRKAIELIVGRLARVVKAVKEDDATIKLQDEFFSKCQENS